MIFKRLLKKRIAFTFAKQRQALLSLLLFLFLQLYAIPYTLYPIFAADSSPSADIKSKLEEFKKEINSKSASFAAQLKETISKKLKDKAYIGKVKAKSESSLTLAATSGPRIVSINQDTLFESKIKSRVKFSQKNIRDEDFIVALGDIDETAVLTAKKIILLPALNSQLKTHLWGQIIAISDKLLTVKGRDNKNTAVIPPADPKVKLNDFVILTGQLNEQSSPLDKNEIFEAEFVYIIPQGGFIKPKKTATPSAQISTKSPTPSAKPAVKR